MQQALQTVGAALAPLEARQTVTGITDWGEDDIAVWRSIWEQEEHGGCCIAHTERHVAYQGEEGTWQTGAMELARRVCLGWQRRPKLQPVQVELWACPLRLRYATNVRREGRRGRAGGGLTDWPVTQAQAVVCGG